MGWIRKSRQIGQAVKNVQRLRQIIGVFAKHGFTDFVDRMNLSKYLPNRFSQIAEAANEQSSPERIRAAFEELGPTFIKLGQLLSTRSDLLPQEYIDEFTKLQDNVNPLPFDVVKATIEAEFGKKIEDVYSWFDPNPLAAASIGQVHEARLSQGEKVVVKIQRPEIEKVIKNDISLLAFLAGLLEKYVPESKIFGPKVIVAEFFNTLSYELDYVVELNNLNKMSENMKSFPEIVIPQAYRSYSSHKVLTLEKFEGIRLNDPKALDVAGIDRKKLVETGAKAFFKSVMIDGIFHGDLHGGNLFILPGNKLGIIDFGIVGRLSEKARDQLANMVVALLAEDYEKLCYQYAELGGTGPGIDFDGFQREVRNALSPYMGLPLSEVNMGKILIEATKIATQYQIKVPGDWMIVFKAILTMEGMGRTLDPSFDLMSIGRDLAKDLLKNEYSFDKLSREFAWVSKDFLNLLQNLPRQIRWMFRKFNSNDFAFEIKSPDLQEVSEKIDVHGRRLSSSIMIAGFFIAGSLSLEHSSGHMIWDLPLVSVLLYGAGSLFTINIIFKRRK